MLSHLKRTKVFLKFILLYCQFHPLWDSSATQDISKRQPLVEKGLCVWYEDALRILSSSYKPDRDLTSRTPWVRTWARWWRRPWRGWGCPPGPRWWPRISPAWCSPGRNNYNLLPWTPISCLNNCSHPHARPVANLDVVSSTRHKPQITKLNSSHSSEWFSLTWAGPQPNGYRWQSAVRHSTLLLTWSSLHQQSTGCQQAVIISIPAHCIYASL